MFRSLVLPLLVSATACRPADPPPAGSAAPAAASAPGPAAPAAARREAPRGPLIATYRPDRPAGAVAGSAAARLDGRLATLGNCLVIAGDRPVQPVFPEGRVRWDEARRGLIVDGAFHPLGGRIALGGGGIGDEAAYAALPGVSVPRCGGAALFIVVL